MSQEGFNLANNAQGIEGFVSKLSSDVRVITKSVGSLCTNMYDKLEDRGMLKTRATTLIPRYWPIY